MRRRLFLAGIVFCAGRLAAGEEFSPAELARPPTAQRVAALVGEAGRTGWGGIAERLRPAVFSAYERQLPQTQAWHDLYRWADWLAQSDTVAVKKWIAAVNAAHLGHPNMPAKFAVSNRPLASLWSPELQRFALGSPEFSRQFFSLLSPVDYPPQVLSILNLLHEKDPAKFKDYAGLALAIAVVYDVSPPPDWPHGQVSAALIERKLPRPDEAFAFFVAADQSGRTLQPLRRLPAAELKFVVDVAAGFGELAWAQQAVRVPLPEFEKVYDLIRYRRDRVDRGQYQWSGASYALPAILQQGGICVDQAYFACMVGKAKGVPTIFFHGAGIEGRHAWFGYLDDNNRWNLDAGRHAEQKYVAGTAHDPQTWGSLTDHELLFLTERFHALPPYQASRLHSDFAAEFLQLGDCAAAAAAARQAVTIESRNLAAWETLLAAQAGAGAGAKAVETTLREAVIAFQHYPDLEAAFTNRLSRSLRARGETSAADYEERRIGRKNLETRTDVSVQQAAVILQRSIEKDDIAVQMRTYLQVLKAFGEGAGVEFFDQVVAPFASHLCAAGRPDAALQAVDRAQKTLQVEPGSQLDHDFKLLLGKVRGQ